MHRTTFLAALLIVSSLAPVHASTACPTLAESRAAARELAKAQGWDVLDLDGIAARKFEKDQDVHPADTVDHLTVISNMATGRIAAVLGDGPCGGLNSVFTAFEPPLSTMDAVRTYLNAAH